MTARDGMGAALCLVAVPVVVVAASRIGYGAAVPATVAITVAAAVGVSWPRARPWIAWPAGFAGAVSVAATALALPDSPGTDTAAGMTGMAEVAALVVLLALVVRWSPVPPAVVAGALVAGGAALWILRFLPESSPPARVGAVALWALGPVAAAVAGGYPRLAARRLARSTERARRAQRRELADDLHDFIAHDVTGMVVQAQAARYAAGDDPDGVLAGLARIEAAGQRALAAMDQLVGVLRDGGAAAAGPGPGPAVRHGLADLPELVARFEAEHPPGRPRVALRLLDPGGVAPQVAATAYRVVVEGLTNIRRHAPDARRVAVEVVAEAGRRLRVTVTNDLPRAGTAGPSGTWPGRAARDGTGRKFGDRQAGDRQAGDRPRGSSRSWAGGVGLVGLAERVAALGGSLVAREEAGEWRLRADLPIGPIRPEGRAPGG